MSRYIALLFASAFLLCALAPAFGDSPVSQASPLSTGVIVPLYSSPGPLWQELISEALAFPSVRYVAVVNVAYGPGWPMNPEYLSGIQALQAAGITVVGYVWTGYGTEGITDWVDVLISEWVSWYGVSGVYLDGMSNYAGGSSYYSHVTAYAHSVGASLVIGNPGTSVPDEYLGSVDVIVEYEGPGYPDLSYLDSHPYLPKTEFAYEAYSVPFNGSAILATTPFVGLLYVSDFGLLNAVNPYIGLPSFLDSLGALLSNSVVVQTWSQSSGTLSGMYVVASMGNQWESCFSPCSFTLSHGNWQLWAANYGLFVFEYWHLYPMPRVQVAVYS